MTTASRTFYTAARQLPGIGHTQSIEDDLLGFEKLLQVISVLTAASDVGIIDKLKAAGVPADGARIFKITIEATEA